MKLFVGMAIVGIKIPPQSIKALRAEFLSPL